ncbi:MAG: hypothetical protein D6732_13415 [Methanobacteriota archaeon]|nr:MAG: hypothetical protein D6732_13415 [Euryarchaeota archaeon]
MNHHSRKNISLGGQHLLIWILMILAIITLFLLGFKWIRAFHLFFGFAWWGMLFFLNLILLPSMNEMSRSGKYEVLGRVFPKIFKLATVNGFMAVSLGWLLALEYFAQWNITYFFQTSINILFLTAISVITLLYLFHLILERNEIETVLKAVEKENDEEVNKLLDHLQLVPRIGFIILTLGALIMFIH